MFAALIDKYTWDLRSLRKLLHEGLNLNTSSEVKDATELFEVLRITNQARSIDILHYKHLTATLVLVLDDYETVELLSSTLKAEVTRICVKNVNVLLVTASMYEWRNLLLQFLTHDSVENLNKTFQAVLREFDRVGYSFVIKDYRREKHGDFVILTRKS